MNCNICGQQAEWVENKEIYGRNYGKSYMMWLCKACGAYVGCHNNTKKPLGTMADKELRELRMKCHALFDTLWKTGYMKRKEAYRFLMIKLNLTNTEAHIGMFNKEICQKLINILDNK